MTTATAVNIQAAKPGSSAQSSEGRAARVGERLTSELVIALVGPLASGCTETAKFIKTQMESDYSYEAKYYKVSSYISSNAKLVGLDDGGGLVGEARITHLQKVGDKLREQFGNSYLTAKAVLEIAQARDADGFEPDNDERDGKKIAKNRRMVHIIDSIKHPEELRLLQQTYGDIFWLIGVFAPLSVRESRFKRDFKTDVHPGEIFRADYSEEEDSGQKVRDVFHQADMFLRNDADNTQKLENDIKRFLELIFGKPVHTPTADESFMYAAHAEAAKSACLSRQVGAAVVNAQGELIGLGRNDVPKYGGGLYSEDDAEHDKRCHAWLKKHCHNDDRKNLLYQQIFKELTDARLLTGGVSADLVTAAIKRTDAKSLIEYSRAVHAEMDAITAVARSNKPGTLGGTLYSTTFPCHSCARHIVASGIHRVIYIEPYPKSLATELHSDSVSENESDKGKRVLFLQFSGVAPKNILRLFGPPLTRKAADGRMREFDRKTARPVVQVSLDDFPRHEWLVIQELTDNEKRVQGRVTPATIPTAPVE